MALPDPEQNILNNINAMFFDFLWNGRSKIKQSVVVKQYCEGRLKMINLKAFALALKITWLRRIFQKESKWQFLIKKDVDTEKIVLCGSEYINSVLTIIKNEFWKDVLKALLKFQLLLNIDWDSSTIYQTPIFYNKNLTVGGKNFFYKS